MKGATTRGLEIDSRRDFVVLRNIPFPPSDNNLLRTLPNGRRVTSKIYGEYKKEFNDWAFFNQWALKEAKRFVTAHKILDIRLYLAIRKERLWNKDGRIKRLDCQNYQKSVIDLLSAMLGIDDRVYFAVFLEKVETVKGEDSVMAIIGRRERCRYISEITRVLDDKFP